MRKIEEIAWSSSVGITWGLAIAGILWALGATMPWYATAAVVLGVAATIIMAHLSDPLYMPSKGRLE